MENTEKPYEYHKKKAHAHKVYNQALRNKKIIASNRCENCLELSNNIHGHHFDYNKPIEVIWLCAQCHMSVHCESKFIDEHHFNN